MQMLAYLILAQVAMGRTVALASVPGFPDLVSVSLSDGATTVEETVCDSDPWTLRAVFRRLVHQLEG